MIKPELKIGQITDLHARDALPGSPAITSRLSRHVLDLLPRALATLAIMKADGVVLTGDLLDVPDELLGDPACRNPRLVDLRTRTEADYRRLRELLNDTRLPWMVLPGNHDFEPAMWRVFDRHENELDVQGWRLIRFCDHEGPGHVPQRIGTERARWERTLTELDPRPQVHAQHFVCTPPIPDAYPHNYPDGGELAQQTGDSGKVAAVLAGHYHRGTDMTRVGDAAFATGPAFCEAPFPFRLYRVTRHETNFIQETVQR